MPARPRATSPTLATRRHVLAPNPNPVRRLPQLDRASHTATSTACGARGGVEGERTAPWQQPRGNHAQRAPCKNATRAPQHEREAGSPAAWARPAHPPNCAPLSPARAESNTRAAKHSLVEDAAQSSGEATGTCTPRLHAGRGAREKPRRPCACRASHGSNARARAPTPTQRTLLLGGNAGGVQAPVPGPWRLGANF